MQLTTNFALSEFACHDVAGTLVPQQYLNNVKLLATNLQVLRSSLGVPVHILSGYRTPAHNAAVGGAKASQHLVAKAGDLTVAQLSPKELHARIEQLIAEGKMKQGGLGLYPGFVHYDVRGYKARW